MVDIAGTQQSVFDPNIGYPGDQYGLPETWLPGKGFIAASDIEIGTFCWGVTGTTKVTQAKGSNTQVAGFVVRSQASVIPYADTSSGYSSYIAERYQVNVLSKGNFIAAIAESFNPGNAINVGDAVFFSNTTGRLAVGVTTQTGYTQTNFTVVITDQYNTNGFDQVVISNLEDFLGA